MADTKVITTTDASLTSDLKASLLQSELEQHDIAVHRTAERLARLCVSLTEGDTLDAAMWKGAEASYRFMDGRADIVPLRAQAVHIRQMHLSIAIAVMASIRLGLEGAFGRDILAQASADISAHKEQLGSNVDAQRLRTQMALVDGNR